MRGDIPSGFSPLPPLRFVRYILITTRLQPFILSSTRAELRLPMPGALSGSSFPILLKNVVVCMKIRVYPSELTVHRSAAQCANLRQGDSVMAVAMQLSSTRYDCTSWFLHWWLSSFSRFRLDSRNIPKNSAFFHDPHADNK